MRTPTRRIAAVSAMTAMALLVAACSGSGEEKATQPAGKSDALAQPADTPMPGGSPTPTPGVGGANQVGSACANLPQSGPGSVAEMATSPVATAIAGNPELSKMSEELEAAGVSQELDEAQDVTVFAPVNDAFDKVPEEVLTEIEGDPEGELAGLLRYHVVEERLTPDNIAGDHTTLEGGTVAITKSGDEIEINGAATVLCGNIPTANGVIYMIDEVLMP